MFCVPRKIIHERCSGWQSGLSETVARVHGDAVNAQFSESLKKFNFLQISCRRQNAPVQQILDYLGQIMALQTTFPGFSPQVEWSHRYQTNERRKRGIAAEQDALYFNLASSYMEEGAVMNDLKTACHAFQYAAGLFQNIGDQDSPLFSALVALCLAQAQECFCQMAMSKDTTPSLVAKMCIQAAIYYDQARYSALPVDWSLYVNCKKDLLTALSHQYRGRTYKGTNDQEIGLAIAHYRFAQKTLEHMQCFQEIVNYANSVETSVTEELQELERDNNQIYHVLVPRELEKAPLNPANMVELVMPDLPQDDTPLEYDLFEDLHVKDPVVKLEAVQRRAKQAATKLTAIQSLLTQFTYGEYVDILDRAQKEDTKLHIQDPERSRTALRFYNSFLALLWSIGNIHGKRE